MSPADNPAMQSFDVIIVGAGAAGLFCAAQAGQRGLKVAVVDHSPRIAEKIRISGGGRCNFTNREAGPAHYLGENPNFCRSALSRYTSADFIALVQRHGVAFHEKHKGQLFCDHSADDIIRLLLAECERGAVQRFHDCGVGTVRHGDGHFEVDTARGWMQAPQLVVATGGLPVPKIGASAWGLELAKQFGHTVVSPRAALVPLVFHPQEWAPFVELAGLSLPVDIANGPGKKARHFLEDLLFTHRGLSGPAVLQISSYWTPGQPLIINLFPQMDLADALLKAKSTSRRQLGNELASLIPTRLAQVWLARQGLAPERPMAECRDKDLLALAESLHRWTLTPAGTEGWAKAEVMAGGVNTRELNSQNLESRLQPGLFFIGEVVDVTGWLGGYNFQWAWSSAHACAAGLQADAGKP